MTWKQDWDEDSQSYYYYSEETGETQWDAPEGFEQDTPASDYPNEERNVVNASDWTKITDEASGEAYFYNETTGETSWDDPRSAELAGSDDIGESELTPCPWAECIDEASGEPYYYNSSTGELVWDKPAEFNQPVSQKTTNTKKDNRDEWTEVWDETYQATYYMNKATEECVWDCPYVEYDTSK